MLTQELYSAQEACKILGCTKRQLIEWVRRGLIRKHPSSRIYFFTKKELEKFLNM